MVFRDYRREGTEQADSGRVLRYLLIILTPLLLVIGFTSWLYLSLESSSRLELLMEQKQGALALQKKETEKNYQLIEADVLFLAHEIEDIRELQPEEHDFLARLKEDYTHFAAAKKIYHQVRLIGLDGRELVRINYNGKHAVVVPDSQLQPKSERYYVKESLQLGAGEVYASQLDLNIEEKRVQMPYVPAIRLAKVLYDEQQGKFAILVLNYLAANILNDIKNVAASTHADATYLINSEGYWLIADDPSLEWGFMFDHKQEVRFQQHHPAAWQTIRQGKEGCVNNDTGLYCFSHVNPLLGSNTADHGQLEWTLLSFTPQSKLDALMADAEEHTLALAAAAFGASLAIAWLFALTLVRNLQANERIHKLSQAVAQAGESVIITDATGTIEYVNDAFTRITGFSKEEALGKNPRILKSGNQPDEYYKRMWDTISRGETFYSSVVDRRKNGSQYPALITISPILGKKGEVTHYVGLQQDMSSHDELEKQFQQAQKMETLGALIAGIAHDFNNFLTGIIGNITVASFEMHDRPETQAKLAAAESLSFQAAHVIKQLMAYSRTGVVMTRPLGLVTFVEESLPLLTTGISENITFRFAHCDNELIVKADPTQLQQVLLNMLNNARDALEGVAEPAITIQIESFVAQYDFLKKHHIHSGRQFARLIIEDNGCGITEDRIHHLFEPFYTTKEVGHGTGLGLSMVLGTIHSHSGVIDVESKPGKGTAFHIFLPVVKEEVATVVSDKSGEILRGRDELILLVDDNADVRVSVKGILTRLNYRVIEASNGLDAVEKYMTNQKEIALIIMDVVMPKLGGVKAAERIQKANPHARVIFSTGYDRDDSFKTEMPSSEYDLLSKPYSIAELSQLMRSNLE